MATHHPAEGCPHTVAQYKMTPEILSAFLNDHPVHNLSFLIVSRCCMPHYLETSWIFGMTYIYPRTSSSTNSNMKQKHHNLCHYNLLESAKQYFFLLNWNYLLVAAFSLQLWSPWARLQCIYLYILHLAQFSLPMCVYIQTHMHTHHIHTQAENSRRPMLQFCPSLKAWDSGLLIAYKFLSKSEGLRMRRAKGVSSSSGPSPKARE